MKKRLLLMAIAGMAMVGCVKDDPQSVKGDQMSQKILFESPFLYDVNTKANVFGELSDELYPQQEDFIIFGVQHEGDFEGWLTDVVPTPNSTVDGICYFSGSTISYNPSFDAWIPTYDNGGETEYYYWPQGKKLSFSAMSPAVLGSGTVTYNATGLNIAGFTNPDAGYQFDLLFARRTMNHTAADMTNHAGTYSGIPISFQHALSSIHFSIDKEVEEQEVYLKKIELTNIKNTGSFAENINESAGLAYVIDQATGNTVTPVWTVNDANKVNYVPFDAKTYVKIPFPVNPQYVSSVVENLKIGGADVKDLFTSSLLVLPQDIGDDVKLVITYEISGVEMVKEYALKGLSTVPTGGIPGGKEGTISAWERGHKYTYRIHYSAASEMKDIIYFSPSVEGWTDVQVIQVTL